VNDLPGVETGRIADHPYVRVGSGDRTLLVVPGLNDPLHTLADSPWFPYLMARYCRRYASTHEVYFVSRPHGLEPDCTTRDLATGYAEVLSAIAGSAATVGEISRAVDAPEHVVENCLSKLADTGFVARDESGEWVLAE